MLRKIFLTFFSALVFLSCKPQNTADNNKENTMEKTENRGIVYLKEGEKKFLDEYKMSITFKQILEDSRCPEDVNCIWEGVAKANIEIMGKSGRPLPLQLSTSNNEIRGYHNSVNFDGYNITLVELTPQSTLEKGFNELKGNYKIGLKIEKGSGENTVLQRGGTTTK